MSNSEARGVKDNSTLTFDPRMHNPDCDTDILSPAVRPAIILPASVSQEESCAVVTQFRNLEIYRRCCPVMTDAVRGLSSEKYKEKARRIGAEIDDYEMRSNAIYQKSWVLSYQSMELRSLSKKRLPNPSAGARCPQSPCNFTLESLTNLP